MRRPPGVDAFPCMEIRLMQTLDLNQLTVETFDVDATESFSDQPIIFPGSDPGPGYSSVFC